MQQEEKWNFDDDIISFSNLFTIYADAFAIKALHCGFMGFFSLLNFQLFQIQLDLNVQCQK